MKVLLHSLLLLDCHGFLLPHTTHRYPALNARPKKRRRRRKESSQSPQPVDSDLPEFDLDDQAEEPNKNMASAPLGDPNEISINMMGGNSSPTKSVDQLIADRSLEAKLEFEASSDDSLPDLLAVKNQEPGKKKRRQQERIAQAQAAKEEEEENFLSKIPLVTDDDGKLAPLKVLENATWLGIFLLIAWEVYINSPLFDRAAPMAPVVY